MNNIIDYSLCELSRELKKKRLSSVEVTRAVLSRIAEKAELNNFVTVCEEQAMLAAEKADERRASGEDGALLGVPVAVKDNIVTRGIRTTCASRMLEDFIPPYDATVVEKLKKAGAVIVGKTNMDEFAMGSTNEYSAFGPARNACDVGRVPGGSSGGSASCVASKQAFGALGSDTGGSIRQPAAYCGVVGLKPTYSAVSRYGLIAFASSLDQIGPIARNTADCLELFRAVVGKDERDTTSSAAPKLPNALDGNVKGMTVGIADDFLRGASSGVGAAFSAATKALERLGVKIKRVHLSSFDTALAVYYVLSSAEAASNLSRYDGVKYGKRAEGCRDISEVYVKTRSKYLGDEVKRRIMIGNYVLSAGYYDEYYLKAAKLRTLIKREYDAALFACDVLLCPTAPTVAPKLGEETDPVKAHYADIYTVPINIAGLPAVSVPFGRDGGMPVGVQVIGRAFDEGTILNVASALEKAVEP